MDGPNDTSQADTGLSRKTYLLVGDTSISVAIKAYKPPILLEAAYFKPALQAIDLDNDGKEDITLECSFSGSGFVTEQKIEVNSNNQNLMIFFSGHKDTVFYLHEKDTNYQASFTEIFETKLITNSKKSDSIHRITLQNIPKTLKEKDSLISSDVAERNKTLLLRSYFTETKNKSNSFDSSTNTYYYYQEESEIQYKYWPDNTLGYIGFKLNNRLGWIKIEVLGGDKLMIYEFAIQK